jgi:succinate dehydrogenase assembly factor 2
MMIAARVPFARALSSTGGSGDENWMPSKWVNEDKDMSALPGLSQHQLEKIAQEDARLRGKHVEGTPEEDEARRKRMIYRSKQRGWLEADLLMGSWAQKYVPALSNDELDEYEVLLKEETIDIYNYISAKDPLPPHLQGLGVMDKLQKYALERGMADPIGYDKVKRDANLT